MDIEEEEAGEGREDTRGFWEMNLVRAHDLPEKNGINVLLFSLLNLQKINGDVHCFFYNSHSSSHGNPDSLLRLPLQPKKAKLFDLIPIIISCLKMDERKNNGTNQSFPPENLKAQSKKCY